MNKFQSIINRNRKVLHGLIPIIVFAVCFIVRGGIAAADVTKVEARAIVQVSEGDEWRYFKGTTKPPYKWTDAGFDDSNWLKGLTGLGYGRGNRTYLGDMQGNYSTVYARRQFTINDIYTVTGMTLSIACDGAFIAYLNGVEIIRNDFVIPSTTTAIPPAEQLDISGFIHELLPGKNVLSVECRNDDISSRDFSFVPVFKVLEHQGRQPQ